ncbi:Elongation factor G C-terminus family protein [Rhizobium leguminosarum]|uniref:Elongation factor G C-terminus family protein n=2 Tax=Rhizobium leguminosarum TaxID=384 RepID=A0A2Z4YFX3_RHILE|nr:Elongation factor G C-terminus family protein [Rhizobium leguminosarum]
MSRDDDVLIDAMVPLAKMLGYASALDVIASGRATYAMRVGHIPIYPFGQQQQYDWH